MNELRTFLTSDTAPTSTLPRVGAPVPTPSFPDRDQRPAVLAFLRHCGCPFAEATVTAARAAAAANSDIRIFLISHASPAMTRDWLNEIGGSGHTILVHDEELDLYRAWGLGYSSLSHFLGMRSLKSVLRLRRAGIVNRNPGGTRFQSAGTFAVHGDDTIANVHIPAHAGDLPNFDQAIAALHNSRDR